MKKLICFTLAGILCLTLTSCGKGKDKEEVSPIPEVQETITPTGLDNSQNIEDMPISTPTPIPTSEPTPTPEPVDNTPLDFKPEISVLFDQESANMDNLTFGENSVELYPGNIQLIGDSFTEYKKFETQQLENNVSADIFTKATSLIDEKIYYVQSPEFLGITFKSTSDKDTEEKDIEAFCDSVRTFSGVFVSDLDLFEVIDTIVNNFDRLETSENGEYKYDYWATDNTEFISVKLFAYKDKNDDIKVDTTINIMLHNGDLNYKDGIRINFKLLDIKMNDENAIKGTIIGYAPAGNAFTAFDLCKDIVLKTVEPEGNVINLTGDISTKYIPETKQTEQGTAYDFSNLKGTFDLRNFTAVDNTYINATDIYGFTSCDIPIIDGNFRIKTEFKGSNYFSLEMTQQMFIDEVKFFTGYNIDINTLKTLGEGEYQVYQNNEDTGYMLNIEATENGTVYTFR